MTDPIAADVAPGTGMGQEGQQPPPPAGESNADTAATGPPETIPYARFKEVNDDLQSLKGYEQLRDWGYDPDSLGRLAQFETAYIQDPAGVVAQLAENLDLPQEVMEALRNASADISDDSDGPTELPGSAQGEPSDDGTPRQASSPEMEYLLRREREREERERSMMEAAEKEASDKAADDLLQKVLDHWGALDERDGVTFTDNQKLTYVAAMGGGQSAYRTAEEMAEAVRQNAMADREATLGEAVRSRPTTGSPLTVPGGASVASPAQNFGADIKAATKAARAAIERGELPGA